MYASHLPVREADQARIDQYTERVQELTIKAIDLAVKDIQPGKMSIAQGKVTFAIAESSKMASGLGLAEMREAPSIIHSL